MQSSAANGSAAGLQNSRAVARISPSVADKIAGAEPIMSRAQVDHV